MSHASAFLLWPEKNQSEAARPALIIPSPSSLLLYLVYLYLSLFLSVSLVLSPVSLLPTLSFPVSLYVSYLSISLCLALSFSVLDRYFTILP